jgi:carbonic anhydrase
MRVLKHLFARNRAWAQRINDADPGFFQKLAGQQSPEYLWIGCSDSRVPANQIVDLLPGEMFVHRNIANVVEASDLNCQSVLQFAVDLLRIRHVIICGHYGCAGIRAALSGEPLGLVDEWLRAITRVRQRHESRFLSASNDRDCADRLCELNVIEQVMNTCGTKVCQSAWQRGQELTIHGWIYGIHDGLLRDLNVTVTSPQEITPVYHAAIDTLSMASETGQGSGSACASANLRAPSSTGR